MMQMNTVTTLNQMCQHKTYQDIKAGQKQLAVSLRHTIITNNFCPLKRALNERRLSLYG